jgi:hypothetical protein
MLLKLFFGLHIPASVLVGYVERMVREHRALLEKFTHIEQKELAENALRPEAAFWRMTVRYGQLEMEAHLLWAEETLAALRKIDKEQKRAAKKKEIHHAG